ncbi:MAG: hypothetical protein K9G26_09565 [Emcibacter sp.]|nr:hypothetical protein [Emcibacter sp.]
MDIILSISNLFGFKLPENFNKPFLAHSFLNFWDRWHISLSSWIKDYLFTPLLKALVYWKSGYWWILLFGIITYFITFLILGIWHGTTLPFIYCGIMLGAGASINKISQVIWANAVPLRAVSKLPLISQGGAAIFSGLTFAHVALAIAGFWFTWEQMINQWNKASIADLVEVYVWATIIGALIHFMARLLDKISAPQFTSLRYIREVSIAINLYLILFAVIEYRNITPAFVYQGF